MIGRGQASDDEANRVAMRNQKTQRVLQLQQFAALKANLDKGLADLAAGRTKDFDIKRIVKRGTKILTRRYDGG